jgi:hypothetical protein
MLNNLYASLARAGEHFSGAADYHPTDNGFEASLQLQLHMPDDARKYAGAYIRQYIKASGWKVSSLRFEKRQVRLVAEPGKGDAAGKPGPASRAESRVSRNFNASLCGSRR